MSDAADEEPPRSHDHRQGGRDHGRLPLVVVGVLAVAALALAGWALLRPAPDSTVAGSGATFTDAQRADGKTKICAAFDIVRKGVTQNTNLQAPGGADDVAGTLAVAANARLSLYDGGQYLLARLDPATPPDLAQAVTSFANNLMDIGAAATAGAVNSEPAQTARLRNADALNATVDGQCR